jgi:carboxymethylenebutenolidase
MTEHVSFPSNGHQADGVLVGEGPGIILIQEWWGLNDHIVDLAGRLAAEGFTVLAPDLYHGAVTGEPDEAGKLMMGLAMDTAAKDIAGAAEFLSERAKSPRIGAVGFCMGGSLALWSATLSPRVVAAVGFYPGLPWERMSPTWADYVGKAALIHAAEGDGGTQASGVQQAVKAITGAGGTVELHDYPGTEHAFVNDTRPEVHDSEAASTALHRTVEFLRGRLS